MKYEKRPTQRALDWRVRAAFSSVSLAQASFVKAVLSRSAQRRLIQTLGCLLVIAD